MYFRCEQTPPEPPIKMASGIFRLTVNTDKRFEIGFRPKAIFLMFGIHNGIADKNYRGCIAINENGKASSFYTNGSGTVSYQSNVENRVLNTDFTIDDTGFTLNCSSSNWLGSTSKKWAFIAIDEPITDFGAVTLMMAPLQTGEDTEENTGEETI